MNKIIHRKTILQKIVFVFIVLFFSYGAANANIYETLQQKSVTINMQNRFVIDLLNEIKRQTNLNFIYNEKELSSYEKKSLNVKNQSAEETLNILFAGTNLTYKIVGESITIIKRAPQPQSDKKIELFGKVVEFGSKKPIAGATVLVLGTTNGAISDDKGAFTIKSITVGATIEISYMGMLSVQRTVTENDKEIVVEMKPDAVAVDDVVITGIFNRKAESYTGSSTTVTAKELKQYGNRNILTSLRNIDPSFNIIENNAFGSNPNKLPEVQIRGNSSLPNVDELKEENRIGMNTPLIILDGFESTLQKMMDMNDNDVASITLLKDASATAIYGSRGANGVIIITTKTPASGKLKISYRGDLNLEVPDLDSYSPLNARDKLELERLVGKFDGVRPSEDLQLKAYYGYLLNEVNSGVDTHWLSKPLRVGVGQRHNIRLEGGDDKFRYSVAAQYNDVQGVMKGSSRRNFNGTISLSYTYKNIKFSNNTLIDSNNSDESPFGNFSTYVNKNPFFRTEDENGNLLKMMGGYNLPNELALWGYNKRYSSGMSSILGNPLYDANLNSINSSKAMTVTNNLSIDWTITSGLLLKGRIGITKMVTESDLYYPASHTMFDNYTTDDLIMRKGKYTVKNRNDFSYDASLNLSYSKTFAEKHTLYVGLDYNIRETNYYQYSTTAEGFSSDEMNFISMAVQYEKDMSPSGDERLSRAIGATGTINYTYDNRYYADLSGRLDGSSAFGSKKRFAPFWSTGIGWNLHNEKFLENAKFINRLKLRGSIGITGSQNFNPYQAISTYNFHSDDRYYNWMGASLMGFGNENLKWQQKMNYNIGLEAQMFDNRITLIADAYLEQTKDLISSVNIPLTHGFSSYKENIGSVENRGFELKLTGVPVRTEDWFWSITGSMIYNKNEITSISQALADAQKEIESRKTTNPEMLYKEGHSINTIWVVPSMGIDPSNGRELYVDRYGNRTYIWDALDLTHYGLAEPKFQGNINTMLRYRNLSLTMSFGYRFGGQIYNSTLMDKVENADYNNNVDSRVFTDRWKKPGDVAAFKGINITTPTYKTSRFVEDECTFNCQNVNLSYELHSKKLSEKLGIEYLTFTANMADLFYISTVKRERGTSYPFARQMSFSLNITF